MLKCRAEGPTELKGGAAKLKEVSRGARRGRLRLVSLGARGGRRRRCCGNLLWGAEGSSEEGDEAVAKQKEELRGAGRREEGSCWRELNGS